MKTNLYFILFILLSVNSVVLSQKNTIISGVIVNENNEPLEGVNVYIKNTINGSTSTKKGLFYFEVQNIINFDLVIENLGYNPQTILFDSVKPTNNLTITLIKTFKELEEVVIKTSTFSVGKDRSIDRLNPLDIVMTGSSNGDIFGAIQALPGLQKVAEDGKLYVRGGDNRETQTFIDGMHVLMPYSSNAPNIPSRGRFSPFLFKNIDMSLGGYDTEYGQALSAILPMETKDLSSDNKIGVNFSPLSLGGGGTKSWKNQSFSFNSNYTDLTLYNKVNPDIYKWKKAYQNISNQVQYKNEIKNHGVFKLYFSYDRTNLSREIEDTLNDLPSRFFTLTEDNYYINSTYKSKIKKGFQLFIGTAYSNVKDTYDGAQINNDTYSQNESEFHNKIRLRKKINKNININIGVENYQLTYSNAYFINNKSVKLKSNSLNYTLNAFFLDNQIKLNRFLYSNLSGRIEFNSYNKKYVFSPRTSLNYIRNNYQLSFIYGKYFQLPAFAIMASNNSLLKQENSDHFILSTTYEKKEKMIKIEGYYKLYNNFALLGNDDNYFSNGYGKSKGFDVYFTDKKTIKNMKYTISYSFCDTKRKYLNFPIEAVPIFGSLHNMRFNMVYNIIKLKTYFGLTNTFSSGRPYNDPNKPIFNSSLTGIYNSLDVNASILVSKKIILYISLSNILGAKNIYSYRFSNIPDDKGVFKSEAISPNRNRFFYIGFFISLKNDTAYDISNF